MYDLTLYAQRLARRLLATFRAFMTGHVVFTAVQSVEEQREECGPVAKKARGLFFSLTVLRLLTSLEQTGLCFILYIH